MNLQVLIPTIDKNKQQIFDLCRYLKVDSDCIIANQNGTNERYFFSYRGYNVYVVCSDTKGVSKNRNILLKNLSCEYGLMLDDDCVMRDNYTSIISNFFDKHSEAEIVLFNGNLVDNGVSKRIHNRRTKRISKYYQISYAGAPGLCFKKSAINRLNLFYDEMIGVPNYIEAGEDTVFHYFLLKAHTYFYRSIDILFDIYDNFSKSSYFNGIDKRYVETRGYITYYIHPRLFCLYKIRHCLRFKRMNKTLSLFELNTFFNNGKKMYLQKMVESEAKN